MQHGFDHDYGFVFKRFRYSKAITLMQTIPRCFIDPLDGALAARVQSADRFEGWCSVISTNGRCWGIFGNQAKHMLVGLLGLLHGNCWRWLV